MSNSILEKILRPQGKGKLWRSFIIIIVLALASAIISFGDNYNQMVKKMEINLPIVKVIPFRLGLDLLGGTQLIYKADISAVPAADRGAAVDGARDVIEKRVNLFGVSEPLVQVNHGANGEYRILVELAGIKDVSEAIKKIGETPLLEFKEENTAKRELDKDQQASMDKFNNSAKAKATDVLGKLIKGGDFAAIAKQFSEDAETKDKGGDLGWVSTDKNPLITESISKLKPGQISKDLDKTATGYEIYKLAELRVKKDDSGADAKEIKASHILICWNGLDKCESGLSKDEVYAKMKKLKEQAKPDNFKELVKANSTEPGAKESFGELGWFSKGAMVKPFEDAVYKLAKGQISDIIETEFGYHLIFKQDERTITEYKVAHIFIKTQSIEDILGPQGEWMNTKLTGKNLKRASVQFDPNAGMPEVSLEFDTEGAKLFEEITGRNIGKPVAIFLDGYPISVPKVNEKITGGSAVINGKFSLQEAKDLSKRLNAGALPVPIELINQKTIGASLGSQAVKDSMKAGLVGLLLVAIFMIVIYRLPGLIATISLIIYGLLVLAIFKLWPVTITLSGLAGFIMSIGVAVDANILIFERLKEELKAGKSLSTAINDGFNRAWPSIRDGNFTIIITCLVLLFFSASVIRGFALTLFLGILVSLFTAIVVTRNLLKLIDERWLEKNHWLIGKIK